MPLPLPTVTSISTDDTGMFSTLLFSDPIRYAAPAAGQWSISTLDIGSMSVEPLTLAGVGFGAPNTVVLSHDAANLGASVLISYIGDSGIPSNGIIASGSLIPLPAFVNAQSQNGSAITQPDAVISIPQWVWDTLGQTASTYPIQRFSRHIPSVAQEVGVAYPCILTATVLNLTGADLASYNEAVGLLVAARVIVTGEIATGGVLQAVSRKIGPVTHTYKSPSPLENAKVWKREAWRKMRQVGCIATTLGAGGFAGGGLVIGVNPSQDQYGVTRERGGGVATNRQRPFGLPFSNRFRVDWLWF